MLNELLNAPLAPPGPALNELDIALLWPGPPKALLNAPLAPPGPELIAPLDAPLMGPLLHDWECASLKPCGPWLWAWLPAWLCPQ